MTGCVLQRCAVETPGNFRFEYVSYLFAPLAAVLQSEFIAPEQWQWHQSSPAYGSIGGRLAFLSSDTNGSLVLLVKLVKVFVFSFSKLRRLT